MPGSAFRGLLLAIASASGMITFIGALRLTTVADVYVIYATVPFVTAGIAWLVLSEKASTSILVASALAVAGVAVTLTGARFGGSLSGQFVAFLMTVSMAFMAVIVRRHREVALFPALGLSAWMAAAVSFWFATPFDVSLFDLVMLAIFGVTQSALGLMLFSWGSRMIPAAEATLLTALDIPLAPLWVWLAFSELPSLSTVAGGIIVLAAVSGHMGFQMHRRLGESLPESPVVRSARRCNVSVAPRRGRL